MSASVGFFNLDENDSSHAYDQIFMNCSNDETLAKRTATKGTSQWLLKFVKMTFLLVIVVMIVLALGWVWLSKHTSYPSEVVKGSFNSSLNLAGILKDQLKTDEQSCEGWIVYKDEKCFKILNETFQTFNEAIENCAQLESDASLPIIHSQEEQSFLTTQLFIIAKKVEGFWIGAKYVSNEDKFLWNDDTDFSYANWNTAKDIKNRSNYCVQMQAEEEAIGKWISVPCGKKNAVVCQKKQTWSMARMQKTHLLTRRQLEEAYKKISDLEHNLAETNTRINKKLSELESNVGKANTKKEFENPSKKTGDLERILEETTSRINKKSSELERNIEQTNNRNNKRFEKLESKSIIPEKNITEINAFVLKNLIPIGFIYAQVPNEKAPSEIWPWMNWTDISTSYAGVFFRVTGAETAEFGRVQQENYPHITHFTAYHDGLSVTMGSPGSNSHKITEIYRDKLYYVNGIAFNVTTGEVRPRNMAIRIWKRTA